MITPKYITVYPNNFKAIINCDFTHILWVKDKANKKFLRWNEFSEMLANCYNEYKRQDRTFLVQINELWISSYPDNKCPKRILIKYIPT